MKFESTESPLVCREYLRGLPIIDLFVALDIFKRGLIKSDVDSADYQAMLESFIKHNTIDESSCAQLAIGVNKALTMSKPWREAIKRKLN